MKTNKSTVKKSPAKKTVKKPAVKKVSKPVVKKAKVTKKVNKNTKRVAKVASVRSPGRPALDIKYPRKKKFSLLDVMELNNVSLLTIRNRVKQDATVTGKIPREGRGHPAYLYTLNN